MFLIRKGEKPRPICDGCHRPGEQGAAGGIVYLCRNCLKKLDRGEGVYVDPDVIAARERERQRQAV
jgi:predicted amidophosphoribosyltransferase